MKDFKENSMPGNKVLNYTNVDYESLREQIEEYLSKDPRFENIRDSAIAKTILDVFAASTDFVNYYIERRAEEQYLETAKLRSSVIMLSRNLGYVPQRPVPAKSALSIILKGPLPSGLTTDDQVTFSRVSTTFEGQGLPFMLRNTYTYQFTSADIADGIGNQDFEKTINYSIKLSADQDTIPLDNTGNVDSSILQDIELLQGEVLTESILGSNNTQTALLFQQYKLDIPKASNYFGEEDEGYDKVLDVDTILENLTKVEITTSSTGSFNNTDNLYTIRRKALINPSEQSVISEIPRAVLMRTAMDGGIELTFGDDRSTKIGAGNATENIHIQYFSTEGAKGNLTGIAGKKLICPNTFITSNTSIDVTNNIQFAFFKNVINGSDLESIDSIKLNAPEIYYSLDRLVTKRDYISYLKTQTISSNGEKIKNAIAWGEQEEIIRRNQTANFRFFNVSFFSVVGSLYKFPVIGTYSIKSDTELIDSHLEISSDFSSIVETTSGIVSADGYPEQSYFNIFVKEVPQAEVKRVEDYRTTNADHPILQMYDKLESRGQTTIKHIYVSPIIQKFKLSGNIVLGKLENRTELKKRINNEIYTWLNENADFSVKVYKSSIYDIIQSYRQVKRSSIFFEPIIPQALITDWDSDVDLVSGADPSHINAISATFDSAISDYLVSAGYAQIGSSATSGTTNLDKLDINTSLSTSASLLSGGTLGIWNTTFPEPYYYEDKRHLRVGNISERTFYTELIKTIYDNLGTSNLTIGGNIYRDSQYFKNIVFKLHNDLVKIIRTSMLDSNGDLTTYSLRNEIPQILMNMNYVLE